MTRILVADDQALVRDGFRAILEAQPDCEVVGAAEDGVAAVELARRLRPDVVLMDIRMPRLDGVEATRRICSDPQWPGRVLVLTTYDADENVWDAFAAGASGFLLKTTTAAELTRAVRAVAAGDELVAPEVTQRLVRQFMTRPRPGGTAPELTALTERELEVFGHLARGLSNADIARLMFVSEATVKSHVNRLFAKLGLRDRVQAVIYAYESGWLTPRARAEGPRHRFD